MRVLLWLAAVVALGVVAWLLWRMAAGGSERSAERRAVRPVPSASASGSAEPVPVEPPVFNQALPTEDAGAVTPPKP